MFRVHDFEFQKFLSWLDGIPQKEVIDEDWKRELLRQSSAVVRQDGASRYQLSSSDLQFRTEFLNKEPRTAREMLLKLF